MELTINMKNNMDKIIEKLRTLCQGQSMQAGQELEYIPELQRVWIALKTGEEFHAYWTYGRVSKEAIEGFIVCWTREGDYELYDKYDCDDLSSLPEDAEDDRPNPQFAAVCFDEQPFVNFGCSLIIPGCYAEILTGCKGEIDAEDAGCY